MQKAKTPSIINPVAKLGTETESNAHTDMVFALTFSLITYRVFDR
jgi:hypothetical protein